MTFLFLDLNVFVQGVSLAQAREKGQLVFLEGLKNSIGVLLQEDTSQETQTLSHLRHVLYVMKM